MVRKVFKPEWRTQSRAKRRFYARYMGWLERVGFVVSLALLGAFAYSFVWQTEDWITAEDVAIEARELPLLKSPDESGLFLSGILGMDGDEVVAGQTIALVYEGPDADLAEAASSLDLAIGKEKDPAVRNRLSQARAAIPLGKPRAVAASQNGVVRFAPGLVPGRSDPGIVLLSLRDYSRLVLKPTLAGKSVPQAAPGQEARLTNLKFNSPSATVLRGMLAGKEVLSRNLVSESLKERLSAAFAGKTLAAREDVPLRIESLESIEVDGKLRTLSGGVAFDPSPETTLRAKVVSGKHVLSAQVGDLPPDLRELAQEKLDAELRGRGLEMVGTPGFVLKLKAGGDPAPGPAIPAASLKRSFEAEVELTEVPKDFVERLKAAHRQSMAVTAKVQVRTGTRSLASLLLRRS